ncbi:unnamed protein product [Tilletia caries]|uniref:Uncharacterized protein n=1 Tax=Tilletia caries TaxID=13290 RepID=A0ABN7IU57_9BASI|nr:unnamed protein product [Tilletia caries]
MSTHSLGDTSSTVVLLTHASSPLVQALAFTILKNWTPAAIILVDHDPTSLGPCINYLTQQSWTTGRGEPTRVVSVLADITDFQSALRAVKETVAGYGRLDFVFTFPPGQQPPGASQGPDLPTTTVFPILSRPPYDGTPVTSPTTPTTAPRVRAIPPPPDHWNHFDDIVRSTANLLHASVPALICAPRVPGGTLITPEPAPTRRYFVFVNLPRPGETSMALSSPYHNAVELGRTVGRRGLRAGFVHTKDTAFMSLQYDSRCARLSVVGPPFESQGFRQYLCRKHKPSKAPKRTSSAAERTEGAILALLTAMQTVRQRIMHSEARLSDELDGVKTRLRTEMAHNHQTIKRHLQDTAKMVRSIIERTRDDAQGGLTDALGSNVGGIQK